jgi:hypothetical protein
MLKPKKGFENSQVSFRVGSATHTIKVSDITPELMDKVKHHVDLSYFVEEVDIALELEKEFDMLLSEMEEKHETIYNPEEHDIETVLQKHLNEKPKKTRKKKI